MVILKSYDAGQWNFGPCELLMSRSYIGDMRFSALCIVFFLVGSSLMFDVVKTTGLGH